MIDTDCRGREKRRRRTSSGWVWDRSSCRVRHAAKGRPGKTSDGSSRVPRSGSSTRPARRFGPERTNPVANFCYHINQCVIEEENSSSNCGTSEQKGSLSRKSSVSVCTDLKKWWWSNLTGSAEMYSSIPCFLARSVSIIHFVNLIVNYFISSATVELQNDSVLDSASQRHLTTESLTISNFTVNYSQHNAT